MLPIIFSDTFQILKTNYAYSIESNNKEAKQFFYFLRHLHFKESFTTTYESYIPWDK